VKSDIICKVVDHSNIWIVAISDFQSTQASITLDVMYDFTWLEKSRGASISEIVYN
jgi:hypothetical protein